MKISPKVMEHVTNKEIRIVGPIWDK